MKKTVLLFGGRSAEHEISVLSAAYLLPKLKEKISELLPVFIGKDGSLSHAETHTPLSASYTGASLAFCSGDETFLPEYAISLLHGTYGEDGAWQGLFSLAEIPLAGSGVRASAAAMHKPTAKRLARAIGIPTLKGLCPVSIAEAEAALSYPMFVKPAESGSSLGARKADNREALEGALSEAAVYGEVMAEEYIDCRELSVAIYEKNGTPTASLVGETIPNAAFYDYDAKYTRKDTAILCPAPIPQELAREAQQMALKIFYILGIRGFARVDLFLSSHGKLFFNEINTLPGYTEHSLFPRLLTATGVDALTPFEEAWA